MGGEVGGHRGFLSAKGWAFFFGKKGTRSGEVGIERGVL
jgi:hypothetical protein